MGVQAASGIASVRVVDAVATGERREDEGQELVADVRPSGCGSEVQMLVDQLAQAQVLRQGGRQEQPRVGHQMVVVKGRVQAVQGVR